MDWKGLGYVISIVSVFLLGAVAWPGEGDPEWHKFALVAGMATSIAGMGLRYLAHLQQQREIKRSKAAHNDKQAASAPDAGRGSLVAGDHRRGA